MHVLKSILLLLLFGATFILADIIELTGNKKIYGQIISINDQTIFIESISKKEGGFQSIALPRSKVVKITDESGTILFSENTQHILVLKRYYQEMPNNWEELNERFSAKNDTVRFKDSTLKGGKIISITKRSLFLQEAAPKSPKQSTLTVNKIPLRKIAKVGNVAVIFIDPQKAKSIFAKKVRYPVYSLSSGVAYAQTNYNQLRQLYQEFYDKSGIPFSAQNRKDGYLGIQAKFEIYIQPYLSFGLSGFFYKTADINSLGMTMADLKYTFHKMPFRPWLSVGFAGHDFSSAEKVGDKKYIWETSKGAVALGGGIDYGDELGTGYVLSVHYLPFGTGTTKIKDSEIAITKKIDFNMLLFSLGIRFNMN
jgi:hypothetical protein